MHPRGRSYTRYAAAVALASMVLAACSFSGDKVATSKRVTTTTEETTTSTTEVPATTLAPSTTAKPAPPGLGQGSRGPEVQALEQRLAELKYDVGKADGVFDSATFHAVMAFQKVEGLPRTGRATDDVVAKVNTAGPPGPHLASGGGNRVEVDLKRQVLMLYKGGALYRTVSVSTGNNKRYCVKGDCAVAVTPGGSFKVNHRINGWRTSRLGRLYNPLYFNGGIAIHGAASVPAYPASHGCVRIPMVSAAWFPGQVPNGTPVYVVGGKRAPVPFNEKAPTDSKPDETTTTAAPATTTTVKPAASTSTPGPTVPASTTTSTTTP